MDGRFSHVLLSHWPVFTLLATMAAAMLVIGRLRRRGAAVSTESVAVRDVIGWALVFVVPPLVYVVALASGFSTQASIFAALLAAMVLMWTFTLIEEFVGPLVAVVGSLFVGLAPPSVALSGFSSPSMLLLVGVFALSAVISSSGLSYRLIMRLLLRLPDRPLWHQVSLLVSGYALSPMVPQTNARLSLLTPIFKDMAAGLRLPVGGPAITALLAATFGGAALFAPMMATSKSANIASLNFLPHQLQVEFNGVFWLVAAAVAALTVTVAHLVVIPWLFRPQNEAPLPREAIRHKLAEMGPLRPAEWTAAGCFLFFLIGISTVSWHHVKPPYLAGCVLLALLVTGAMLRKDFRTQLDWPQIFFLLGLDSMVRIMDYLGLQQALASAVRHYFDFVDGNIAVFILVCLAVTLAVRLALPVTAGALTAAVILLPIATSQGINPWIVIFCAAVFSDIAFFRYQGTNGLIQIHADGLVQMTDERSFRRYTMIMYGARVVAVYASIPWWMQLGLL